MNMMTVSSLLPRLLMLLLVTALLPTLVISQTDEYGFLDRAPWFSNGIFMIIVSYVPLISICVGQYRQAVDLNDEYWNQSVEKIVQARKAINRGFLEAMFIWTILLIALAVIVAKTTSPLDERMEYIIEAASRLTAAVIMGMLSIRVAIWVDLYGHPFWRPETAFNKRLGTTTVELTHRVRWSISKRILRLFFLFFMLFQGVEAATIPASILCGLAFGLFIDFGIYFCRRWESYWRRRCISICFVVACMIFCILLLSSGVLFIAAVWESNVEDVADATWDIWTLLIAIVILPLIHVLVWQLGKRNKVILQEAADEAARQQQDDEENKNGDNRKVHRPQLRPARMATSMIFSDRNIMKKMKELEKLKSNDNPPVMPGIGEEGDGEEEDDDKSDENPETDTKEQPAQTPADSDNNEKLDTTQDNRNVQIDDPEEEEDPPTTWELLKDWQCCGCVRGEDTSIFKKAANCINWFLYICICLMCVFCYITNAGATHQQNWARDKLPHVAELLYNNMDEGPVCAYDAALGMEGSNPTTFPDQSAAHLANYSILHCGPCNHCSDWHNLELEYTTRKFLAEEGKNCAKQSLFGGGYPALVECLENPEKIGWEGTCANCWADDIECTKAHCAFIGLQSFFINTLSNFEVTANTITSATCEEAHCEAGNHGKQGPDYMEWWGIFVECSGANRRRMGVTSSIARPGAQQCSIVDVDWDELFPELHPNDPDYGKEEL